VSFADLQRALREALEQQTATTEILRVIASSPTDVQPVFDTILASATTLLGGFVASITRRVGDDVHMAAFTSMGESLDATVRQSYPVSIDSPNPHSMAIRRCEPHIIADADTQPDIPEPVRRMARARGWRSNLAVPLRRIGTAIGALGVSRRDARGFTPAEVALLQTFADQAVIAIENVRLLTELQGKNRALTEAHAQVSEALDQQTATSEILRVISSSPTDVQPTFDAIAASATRLCEAVNGLVMRYDGELVDLAAYHNVVPERLAAIRQIYPMVPDRRGVTGRVILTRAVVHLTDVTADPEYALPAATTIGYRSVLGVPMLREGAAIGAILVARDHVAPFSDKQIALLKTFADQAVIAIENVRLFNETTEALDRQTATAEILRVISSSPTDLQPVLDAVAERAARLCSADDVKIHLVAGDTLRLAAQLGPIPSVEARPIIPTRHIGRAVLERRTIHVHDMQIALDEFPDAAVEVQTFGVRTSLATPLLREGKAIGVIQMRRLEVEPFSEKQIALLETFADQAVIAIENVRLFKELEARTHELTRSVGELRALGEVGQAISSTLDLQTVLSTIAAWATQLSGTDAGVIYEYDEHAEIFVPRATEHLEAEIVETMLATPVRKGEGATGRLAEVQEPVQVPDILAAPAESRVRGSLVHAGYRALLAVPLVREDHLIGGLTVIRKATGDFGPDIVELLKTSRLSLLSPSKMHGCSGRSR
jgi:GAF domain-containing protein